jgi:hypothetical protein
MDRTGIPERVLGCLVSERIALSDDLTEIEAVVDEQVRRIGARAIELHLAGRKLGYEGYARPCGCGGV